MNGGEGGMSTLDRAVLIWASLAAIGMWAYHRRSKRA